MPINYKEYPENWKWLSKQIIADAGNKCEMCYAPNGCVVIRSAGKCEYPWYIYKDGPLLSDEKLTKIVLTVHHIDGDKMNNSKQNLICLCQKDHLRLDLCKHLANRKRNKAKGPELDL